MGLYATAAYIVVNPEPFVKLGYWGVFIFNLLGPGTIIIPIMVREGLNVWYIALVTAVGMTINDSVSYVAGRFSASGFYQSQRVVKMMQFLGKYDTLAIFLIAAIPFPLDLLALVAGHAHFPFARFAWASLAGKLVRSVLVGYLTIWYGDQILNLLQQTIN